jgi:hypothetical protein
MNITETNPIIWVHPLSDSLRTVFETSGSASVRPHIKSRMAGPMWGDCGRSGWPRSNRAARRMIALLFEPVYRRFGDNSSYVHAWRPKPQSREFFMALMARHGDALERLARAYKRALKQAEIFSVTP